MRASGNLNSPLTSLFAAGGFHVFFSRKCMSSLVENQQNYLTDTGCRWTLFILNGVVILNSYEFIKFEVMLPFVFQGHGRKR